MQAYRRCVHMEAPYDHAFHGACISARSFGSPLVLSLTIEFQEICKFLSFSAPWVYWRPWVQANNPTVHWTCWGSPVLSTSVHQDSIVLLRAHSSLQQMLSPGSCESRRLTSMLNMACYEGSCQFHDVFIPINMWGDVYKGSTSLCIVYSKASPLPPAPSATGWLLICRLNGFERFAGLTSLKNAGIAYIFSSRFQIFCFTDSLIFRGLGGPVFKYSGSRNAAFSLFGWSLGAKVHSDGTRIDFQQFGVDFGSPSGDRSGSLFHIFSDLNNPKSHLDCSHVFCWFLYGNSGEFWCPNPSRVL